MGSSIIALAFAHFVAVSDASILTAANEYAFSLDSSSMYQEAKSTKPPFVEVTAMLSIIRKLREGGYTLYLRHGTTDSTIADRVPSVDLNECSTQRPLTEADRQFMAKVGESIRKGGIPIDEFKVSPMCRAHQSAAAAFPNIHPLTDNKLMYVANFTVTEKAPIIANTRNLLSTPVPSGSNRLVLPHAPNLTDLIGYFPKEGTLVIFRHKGEKEGFDYIASVTPTSWDGLLRQDRK